MASRSIVLNGSWLNVMRAIPPSMAKRTLRSGEGARFVMSAVQVFYFGGVRLVDAGAAHLHGGRHFTIIVVELFREQVEATDVRHFRQPGVALMHLGLDEFAHLRQLDQ